MSKIIFDSNQIQAMIPHRYPFLMVDRIIELDTVNKVIKGVKTVTANEIHFMGSKKHVMPVPFIIEAMAQTGSILLSNLEEYKNELALFAGLENCEVFKDVVPGDTIIFEMKDINLNGRFGTGHATASVDGEVAVSAAITFGLDRRK